MAGSQQNVILKLVASISRDLYNSVWSISTSLMYTSVMIWVNHLPVSQFSIMFLKIPVTKINYET